MIEHEIQRIAAAANQLRPDWPIRQLLTLLNDPRLSDRPRRDVTVALAWVACENGTSSPYRVLESGPWWIAAAADGQTTGRREPFDPMRFCSTCNKPNDQRHPADHAFVSAAEHRAHRRAAPTADRLDQCRQAIGDSKAERVPAPKPEHEPNPRVDDLRAAIRHEESA